MHRLPVPQPAPLSFDSSAVDHVGQGPLAMRWLAFDAHAQHAQALNGAVAMGVQVPHLAQHIAVSQEASVRLLATPTLANEAQWPSAITPSYITNALGLLQQSQAHLLLVCTYDSEAVHVWCVPRLAMPDCGDEAVRAEHAMAASHFSWGIGSNAAAPSDACLKAFALATRLLWLLQTMRAQQAPRWVSELLGAVLQCEAMVGAGPDKGNTQNFAPLHALMSQAWLTLMQFDALYTPQAMRAIQAWAAKASELSDPLWRARAATVMAHAQLLRGVRGQDASALLASANTLSLADVAALRVRDRLAWAMLHWHCAQAFEALWLMRHPQDLTDLPQLPGVSTHECYTSALGAPLHAHDNDTVSVSWLRQSVSAVEQVVRVFPTTCATGLWARLARGRTTKALGSAVADQGVLMLAIRVLDHLQLSAPAAERHVAAQAVLAQVPLLMGDALANLARLRGDKVQMVLALQQFEVASEHASNEPLSYAGMPTEHPWAAAQYGLGNSLLWLAQFDDGHAQHSKYERGVAALTCALSRRRLSSAPVEWSHTQAALGRAHALWSRAKPVLTPHRQAHLEQAVAAYGLALSAPHTLGLSAPTTPLGTQANQELASAGRALGFVRAQLLSELGGVWLELGGLTGSAASVQASIDCLSQALREAALPDANLRVLLHNNLASAYRLLATLSGSPVAYTAAEQHYEQALSLLQLARAPAPSWLPVVSNWANLSLRALLAPSPALAFALSWSGEPMGEGALAAATTHTLGTVEHAQQQDTLQKVSKALTAVLVQDPDCALARWQLARVYGAMAALLPVGVQQQVACAGALEHGQALHTLLLANPGALSAVRAHELNSWLAQVALVQALCAPSAADARVHLDALSAAVDSFQAASDTAAPVWCALAHQVLCALTVTHAPPSSSKLGGELSGALHVVWQSDSQLAARLERLVTLVDEVLQRWLQSAHPTQSPPVGEPDANNWQHD